MIDMSRFADINPYVRIVKVQREASLSGKWKDIDNLFTYIASGSADFFLEGKRYPLHTGRAILIPPYMTHVIVSNGSGPFVQYNMHFDFYEMDERKGLIHRNILEEEGNQGGSAGREDILENRVIISEFSETNRNRLTGCFLDMLKEFFEQRPGRELLLKAGCLEILTVALRNCVDIVGGGNSGGEKSKSWVHIENAIDYIQNCDLNGDLTNDGIAGAIGVSPNYLTGVFQSHLGITLHKYVMNVRIERAQQLLHSGTRNITEAANQTGFSSIHVFSKSFKNIMGITPSQFLNEIASKEYMLESETTKMNNDQEGNYVD